LGSKSPDIPRHPLSRSYRVSLPSSLTMAHSSTLGHLSSSTCVGLRYGLSTFSHARFFLAAWLRPVCGLAPSRSALGDNSRADLPTRDPYHLRPSKPTDGWSSLLRHPSWSDDCRQVQEYSTCFPSLTPFGLSLGSD
jgi:hypothetical protein